MRKGFDWAAPGYVRVSLDYYWRLVERWARHQGLVYTSTYGVDGLPAC